MCSPPTMQGLPVWVAHKYFKQLKPNLGTKWTPPWWQTPFSATAHTSLAHKTGVTQRAGAAHAGLLGVTRRMVSSLHSLAIG